MEFITLTVSAQTLNAIGIGLRELPFKVAEPAIAEIDVQVQAFVKAKEKKSEGNIPGAPPAGPSTVGEVPPDAQSSSRISAGQHNDGMEDAGKS